MREYLAEGGAKRIHVEAMPGYAPDLSPLDQGCWQHLKHVEMRNLACMDIEELHLEVHLAIGRLRQKGLCLAGGLAEWTVRRSASTDRRWRNLLA